MPDPVETDTIKKKNSSLSHENEVKKTQSATKQTEGEAGNETKESKPVKKASGIPKAKPPKISDDKAKKKKEITEGGGKKMESALAQSKKAQRAKASLAITKTDHHEKGSQKVRPLSSTDKIAHKGAGEKHKPIKQESKTRRAPKPDSEKQISEDKKKSKANIQEAETESEEIAEKKSVQDVKAEEESPPLPEDVDSEKEKELSTKDEIPPSNIPSYPYSTCSFFEKIQQGVKAYFSSRNSLGAKPSMEDKSQTKVTEGGIDLG